MITLAVEVGERWIVRGWACCACVDAKPAKVGLGRARTWNKRFDSRKLACNSITGGHISFCLVI